MTAYRFRLAPKALHWDEPDAGCVGCGQPYLTIDDHRCGTCLGEPVGFCPLCLGAIGPLIEREVARRWRAASHDVNDDMTERDVFTTVKQAMAAEQARSLAGMELRRDKLRERLYGEAVPS